MNKCWLSKDKNYFVIKISGSSFQSLLEILRTNKFWYAFTPDENINNGQCESNVWYKHVDYIEDFLFDVQSVEPLSMTDELKKRIDPDPETEYLRVSYDPSLLTTPPLAEYQERTIKQGIKQTRCYLAHKQGLGKTYMAFGILNHLWHNDLVDRCLIVCRPEGVHNLKRELLRFNTFGLTEDDIYIVSVKNREPFASQAKVIITNYRSFLMLCSDEYKKTHKGKVLNSKTRIVNPPIDLSNWGEKGRVLFLDEAHSVKNRQAGQTKCLIKEAQFFRFRYLMSGTPYPKGVMDLWSQFKIMDPNIIHLDYNEWMSRIAFLGTRFSEYQFRAYKPGPVKSFLKKVEPWIIREFADDNLKLPEQVVKKVYFELSAKQRKIYQQFVVYVMNQVMENNTMKTVMREVYKQFSKVQQACIDPCLMKDTLSVYSDPDLIKMVDQWKFEDNPRLEMCDSILEDIFDRDADSKVIIWSGHPGTIKRLGEYYAKYNPVLVHGEIKANNQARDEQISDIVDEFKNGKDHRLLIASYYMIATSQNIIESNAMIYFDRAWDFVIYDQSRERNHRPTSMFDSIEVYNLIGENTIEEKQDRVLEQRDNIDRELLNFDSLTKEQWRDLFEGKEL